VPFYPGECVVGIKVNHLSIFLWLLLLNILLYRLPRIPSVFSLMGQKSLVRLCLFLNCEI
jgi:hypothetical protein